MTSEICLSNESSTLSSLSLNQVTIYVAFDVLPALIRNRAAGSPSIHGLAPKVLCA